VFDSLAPSNKSSTLNAAYCKYEQEKCCAYEERVQEVEHAWLINSLGFLNFWWNGKSCHLCTNLLSIQCNIPYPLIIGWLHCTFNFSLLKSSIMCIRGSRSSYGHPGSPDLVLAESRVSLFVFYPLSRCPLLFFVL